MGGLIDFNLDGKTVAEKFYSLEADVDRLLPAFSTLRRGQAIYLIADQRFPEVKSLPESVDCFYVDALIDDFLAALKTSIGVD